MITKVLICKDNANVFCDYDTDTGEIYENIHDSKTPCNSYIGMYIVKDNDFTLETDRNVIQEHLQLFKILA